jgi:hypothetical protein
VAADKSIRVIGVGPKKNGLAAKAREAVSIGMLAKEGEVPKG